jgi:hypothetical protein
MKGYQNNINKSPDSKSTKTEEFSNPFLPVTKIEPENKTLNKMKEWADSIYNCYYISQHG